jgi:hypothetical protein
MHAAGTYDIRNWDQQTYDDTDPMLARASVQLTFAGAMSGSAATEYLMINRSDGTAGFIGQIRFTGSVGGRSGSVVLHESGEYDGVHTARGMVTIVPDSGVGELAGITGSGAYVATHGDEPVEYAGRTWQPTPSGTASYVLEYNLD